MGISQRRVPGKPPSLIVGSLELGVAMPRMSSRAWPDVISLIEYIARPIEESE